MRPYYVTTPLYYVNDQPHLGHAYTTVAADVLARFARLVGRPVRFLTGTDEHGQKIERKAQSLNVEPQAFVDRMSPPFRTAFEELGCSFDDYIRTTEPRHTEKVQKLWRTLREKGDIYLGEYEGWYSVSDEAFITEKDLEKLDPVTRQNVERVSEKSYFFKLSAYTDRLLEFYEKHPTFVQPEGRFNEVKAFVREGLRDLSVSRTTFKWGVPVPDDPDHVMYVWLDALTNYISALGGPAEAGASELYDKFWAPNAEVVQVMGKDIIRFHAVYWPAFLLSAGLEPPGQVWAHGWLTINGEKMSKRLGNFIAPGPLVKEFGADVFRYYLMRAVSFGQDGDFSHQAVLDRYNGELANGLGNLLNRMVASIVQTSFGGKVPDPSVSPDTEPEEVLIAKAKSVAAEARAYLEQVAPHRAIDTIWQLVAEANRYIDVTAPWVLAKAEDPRLARVAYTVLETLRWLSLMIAPFMPAKADELRRQLGLEPVVPRTGTDQWPTEFGALAVGIQTAPDTPLFPRIDKPTGQAMLKRLNVSAPIKKPEPKADAGANAAQKKPAAQPAKKAEAPGPIEFDDFMKVDLRVGVVKEVHEVKKSKRLFRLLIDVAEPELRQVLAGIKEHYEADELVGRRVVVVVNLKPRKMMGFESCGMVLAAAGSDSGLCTLTIDRDIPPGTRVS